MRKREREVTDPQEKLAVLLGCPFLTLALHGEGAPYCVPLNFGAEEVNGRLVLYFHCALEGTKLDLLRADAIHAPFGTSRHCRPLSVFTMLYARFCHYGTNGPDDGADGRDIVPPRTSRQLLVVGARLVDLGVQLI